MATTTWSASSNIELASVVSLDHLLGQLDTLRNPNNLFFAVRIDGQFSYVHTRAVCKAEPAVRSALHQASEELKKHLK